MLVHANSMVVHATVNPDANVLHAVADLNADVISIAIA
jgi:hypothetical protein